MPGDERAISLHPQSRGAPVTLPQHSIPLLVSSAHMLEQYITAEAHAACDAWRARRGGGGGGGAGGAGGGGGGACVPRVHAEVWKAVNGGPLQRWADPAFDFGAWLLGGGNGNGGGGGSGGGDGGGGWMLPRLAPPSWRAEAEVRSAAEAWRRRGYTVELFAMGDNQPPLLDRILSGSGYREASLVALHGAVHLSPAPGTERFELKPGEARPLQIGREHRVGCGGGGGGGPCSWAYAMR